MDTKPTNINILGKDYTVEYVDKPSDVDIYKRVSLWGQIDFWTRTIRIYDNERSLQDIWHTIFHEIIHAIACELHIEILKADDAEASVDLLALAFVDTIARNGWMPELSE